MAGMMGMRSAIPRLSPAAISAICWAAKAASQQLREAKKDPAIAGPVSEDRSKLSEDLEVERPMERFWGERREMGFGVGLDGLKWLGELMLKHLTLRMAIVAMVAMNVAGFFFLLYSCLLERL
eukprot:TRINITY_DN1126_c0_g1_i1.p2 TRINITY_DN1126_c0_g1~~TRINITY_DN1126_c0_g1_i1.p2  ORF type:complete len:123 (-),score=27.18 TRINITY_DN1126_c0_g1_i1:67-435(-)